MADNEIRSANDIELVVEGVNQRGTSRAMGRLVVDDFSFTREQDSELGHGVGYAQPAGIVDGSVTYSVSFTMMGDDVDLFETISDRNGDARVFAFVARAYNEDDTVAWEKSLDYCKGTEEETSASAGDAEEYSVSAIGVQYDRQ